MEKSVKSKRKKEGLTSIPFNAKEKILYDELVRQYERVGAPMKQYLTSVLHKNKNDKIDIIQHTLLNLTKPKTMRELRMAREAREEMQLKKLQSQRTVKHVHRQEEPKARRILVNGKWKIVYKEEEKIMDTLSTPLPPVPVVHHAWNKNGDSQEEISALRHQWMEAVAHESSEFSNSKTWIELSAQNRLALPSKRALEKLILRHEIPPFVIKTNTLCYYIVMPKSASDSMVHDKLSERFPNTVRPDFHVWPLYIVAHQKRMSGKDQKRYVDLFYRRTCTPLGCALGQLNHVFGLYRAKLFHRLYHIRQMVRHELIKQAKNLIHKETTEETICSASTIKTATPNRTSFQKHPHKLVHHTLLPDDPLTENLTEQSQPQPPPPQERQQWYEEVTFSDTSIIVKAQDPELRHVTANIMPTENILFDYPCVIQTPLFPCQSQLMRLIPETPRVCVPSSVTKTSTVKVYDTKRPLYIPLLPL